LKNLSMARDYAERALWSMREAEQALDGGKPAISVRRSQEAMELAAKAILRKLAIEYPREHDVSDAIVASVERLPQYLRDNVEEIKTLLRELARVRGPAFYGYETEGIPASQAFTKEYATEILSKTKLIVNLCHRFATG
jgi:HEPN domain-containing protein